MSFTAPIWNLQQIITETRGITGRPDVSMMSDAEVVQYINYYYQFVMPKELKIFWGYTYYKFFCQPNIDQYPAPVTFQTFNPQVWCDGFGVEWYSDPDTFYQDYPLQLNKQPVGLGNGSQRTFAFVVSAFPILPGSLYVSDGTATNTAQDNGNGGFISPSTGSINYVTGSVSVTFPTAPASNVNVICSSQTYIPNRPQSILFFKSMPLANANGPLPGPPATLATRDSVNMFVLRPVPDQTYQITMQGIQVPNALVNLTDVPYRPDLGPLIALGASLHIFKVFNQMDQYDQNMPEFMRFKDVCMQDTYEELLYQRSIPTF